MENRVGDLQPSEKELAQLVKDIQSVGQRITKFGVTLDAVQRKRAPKPHDGSEQHLPLLVQLVTKYELKVPGMSLDEMQADLKLATALRPVQNALDGVGAVLSDTTLEALGEYWTAFTSFYTMLSTMSARNPQLAAELKPLTDFFAHGRRKPKTPAAK